MVGAGAVAVTLLSDGEGTSSVDTTITLNTAEVVVADLEELTTLDGTLGREAGDPVRSGIGGTITAAPEPGEVLVQGDVLFEVDGEPVMLLDGPLPAFRDLTLTEDAPTVASRSFGTVTGLPVEGSVIDQGEALFEVNGEPVILLFGEVPAYRALADLRTNLTGNDVLQLEEALVALGFATGMTVDGEFTDVTESRVEDWQEAMGATVDGTVDLGEVVFLPGPVEVVAREVEVGDAVNDGTPVLTIEGSTPLEGADVLQLEAALTALGFDAGGQVTVDGIFTGETVAAVVAWQTASGMEPDGVVDVGEVVFVDGSVRIAALLSPPGSLVSPGAPVLDVTGNDIVIVAGLPAADQGIVAVGDAVTVELPDNSRVPGSVTEVATVATRVDNATFFEVTVELDDASVAGDLDEAPVDVEIVTDSVSGVVAVPVGALLALREGGYAVEVDAGDGVTSLVAVEPGFFADGMVEVVSDGLRPGMRVVVP
ncbi:MAG: peptidoglycan-binding protein [Acidimicrobiia bacterium]